MRNILLLEVRRVLVLANQMKTHRIERCRMALLLLALLTACAAVPLNVHATALEVTRVERDTTQEIDYEVAGNDCAIVWTLRRFTHMSGFGLSERSRCNAPLAEQAAHRRALLVKVEADNPRLDGVRNFYWGNLHRADATVELLFRLQRVAAKSPWWSTAKGRPASATEGSGRVVQLLLNKHLVFTEIADVFAAEGFKIEVNSVERVMVGAHHDATNSHLKVPIDALVTLSVTRIKTKP